MSWNAGHDSYRHPKTLLTCHGGELRLRGLSRAATQAHAQADAPRLEAARSRWTAGRATRTEFGTAGRCRRLTGAAASSACLTPPNSPAGPLSKSAPTARLRRTARSSAVTGWPGCRATPRRPPGRITSRTCAEARTDHDPTRLPGRRPLSRARLVAAGRRGRVRLLGLHPERVKRGGRALDARPDADPSPQPRRTRRRVGADPTAVGTDDPGRPPEHRRLTDLQPSRQAAGGGLRPPRAVVGHRVHATPTYLRHPSEDPHRATGDDDVVAEPTPHL